MSFIFRKDTKKIPTHFFSRIYLEFLSLLLYNLFSYYLFIITYFHKIHSLCIPAHIKGYTLVILNLFQNLTPKHIIHFYTCISLLFRKGNGGIGCEGVGGD